MASSAKVSKLTPPTGAVLERFRHTGEGAYVLEYVQTRLREKTRRRKKMAKTVGAAAAVALFLWAVPYFRSTSAIATLPSHRQQLTLADGSETELNARTAIRTDFRYGRRTVQLTQGEAFFAVTKDPAHPFLVETPLGTVRVLGTRFNVRLDSSDHVIVTLLEGSVEFSRAGELKDRLIPGQQLVLDPSGGARHDLSATELDAATAWRQGRIVLDGLTMAQVSARVADFHGCRITVSPAIAAVRLGGTATLDDLGKFFDQLKVIGGVQVVDLGDGSYQITGR
jgi:transmembrane sensor